MNSGPPSFELESTRSESHAIADRVTVIGERTLLMREISVQSPSSVSAMFDRLETLSRDWERFSYVVDLTEAKRPGPETRAALKERVRRVSPRVVLCIPISYRFGNTIAAALTLNLSRGGIAIRTTSPLENGAKVRLRYRLPGSKRDIDAEGRVAWSDRRHGMGLQFEKVEPQDQSAIDEFVDAHFFSSRKS